MLHLFILLHEYAFESLIDRLKNAAQAAQVFAPKCIPFDVACWQTAQLEVPSMLPSTLTESVERGTLEK